MSVRSAVVHRSQREVRALHVQFCDATVGGRPDRKRSSIWAGFPDWTRGGWLGTLAAYGSPVDALCIVGSASRRLQRLVAWVGRGKLAVPANEHRIDVCKAVRRQSEASR